MHDTSLDPVETTVEAYSESIFPDVSSDPELDKHFRHTGWGAERRRVAAALAASGAPKSRVLRFAECGSNAYVYASIELEPSYRIVANFCRDRFCRPCANAKASSVGRNLLSALPRSKLRFITLTLKHQIRPLSDTIDHLYKAFRRLRHRPFWRDRVRAGVAFCEIKWSPKTSAWNVHLHMLVESDYLPAATLSNEWLTVTGDSFIVDIRLVHSLRVAASYVVKYASKGICVSSISDLDHLVEAVGALRGRRMCLTFGTWAHVHLSEVDRSVGWELLASLQSVVVAARFGDERALGILASVRRSSAHTEDSWDSRAPPLFASAPPPDFLPVGWHSRIRWMPTPPQP